MFDNFNLSVMNTIQYHTPADLLPFGITAKVAYAPSSSSAAAPNNSYKAGGAANVGSFTAATTATATADYVFGHTAVMGQSATHFRVDATPIDGLKVGADYVDYSGVQGATAQGPESGAYYATYAFGPATIGYSKGFAATAATGAGATVLESLNLQRCQFLLT